MADAYTMQRNFTDIGDFLQLSVEMTKKIYRFSIFLEKIQQ